MDEKDSSSNYLMYTEGIGPSSRIYRDINRYENGWIQLVGFDRDAWIIPATDVGALEEFDTPEFSPNPEIYESSGQPKNWPAIREAVLQREHYLCQNCDDPLLTDGEYIGVVHHAVKPDHGGREVLSNLLAHCEDCKGRFKQD